MVPNLPLIPDPEVCAPITGGQYAAHAPLQFDLVAVSMANQYSVKPLAFVSTLAPPIVVVFSFPDADGVVPPDPATATPSSTRATTDSPAIAGRAPGMPACSLARTVCRAAAGSPAAGVAASTASAANATTSMIPAMIPAVVRTSLNPNRPIHTDKRYPPSVDRANPAPAAAASLLPVASTAAASTKAAMT